MEWRACAAAVLLVVAMHSVPAQAGGGDPLRSEQWGLDQVHIDQAWRTTTGQGVVVAVIDNGVDVMHPDLRGQFVPGHDFSGTGNVQDDCGHGTEVAGVIIARRANGRGIAGVAPGARVMPLREGGGCAHQFLQIIEAISWAADHGAKVVNISVGTVPVAGDALVKVSFEAQLQAAVDHAWARGTLVVAGAGNSTIPICGYPAAAHRVLCVGAVGQDRLKASYSNNEARTDVDYLVAPGGAGLPGSVDIWTTMAGSRGSDVGTPTSSSTSSEYAPLSGTSFSGPFVAGIAALLFSQGLNVQQVHDRLLHTATDLGVPGRDPIYGWGEVDAAAALKG